MIRPLRLDGRGLVPTGGPLVRLASLLRSWKLTLSSARGLSYQSMRLTCHWTSLTHKLLIDWSRRVFWSYLCQGKNQQQEERIWINYAATIVAEDMILRNASLSR